MDWDGKGRRREAAFLHVGFLLGREGSRGTDGHRPLVLKRPHLGLSKPSERGPSIQGLLSLKSFILLFLDRIEMLSDFFSFCFVVVVGLCTAAPSNSLFSLLILVLGDIIKSQSKCTRDERVDPTVV